MAGAQEVRKPTGVTSGERGKPVSELFARIEQTHPGIERMIGVSSAALRAGEIVRSMRKAKGWTQTQLADLLGWDQERISNIERGEGTRGPTFDVLMKIATVCDYGLHFSPGLDVGAAIVEKPNEAMVMIEAEPAAEAEPDAETYTKREPYATP